MVARDAIRWSSLTETHPAEALFRSLESGFVRAASQTGTVTRAVRIPGGRASFEFAGEALARALSAGLVSGNGDTRGVPLLLARVWDSASSRVPPPPLPPASPTSPPVDWPDRVDAWIGKRFRATVTAGFGMAMAWDVESQSTVAWLASPEAVPPWEAAAPLRSAWAWWAESTGAALAHAAAVGETSGAVLLTGPGGSGKSTTALACLRDGMRFAGDDYVLVRPDPPRVFGLFSTAKLRPEDLRTRLPEFQPMGLPHDPRHAKQVVALTGALRERFAETMPLRVIVVPRVAASGRVTLRPIGPGTALRALGPPSVLQIPGTGPEAFARLAALAEQLPAFALEVGPDLRAVVAAVRRAIDEAAPR